MTDIHANDEEWKALLAALGITGPLPEHKILQLAAKRIGDLQQQLTDINEECEEIAQKIFPGQPFPFASMAVSALKKELDQMYLQNHGLDQDLRLLTHPEEAAAFTQLLDDEESTDQA